MPQIARVTGNMRPFAIDATQPTYRTTFGEVVASDDLTANLTPEYFIGWEATTSAIDFPTIQDFAALGFTATQFIAYLHQVGVPMWDSLQEYYVDGYAKASDGSLYRSKTGIPLSPNVGNDPVSDPVNWETISATAFQNHILSDPGYQIFPGGLIFQWMTVNVVPFGSSVNLPITFPNAYLGAVGSDNRSDCQVWGITSSGTGAVQVWNRLSNSGNPSDVDGQILAWGY